MAYSAVQVRGTKGSGDSLALSFTTTPSVGSLVTVCASIFSGALADGSVTDNQGGSNTYNRRIYNASQEVAIYDCVLAAASGTFTITVNPTGASSDIAMGIAEFSGNTATPIDQTLGTSAGTSTAATSGDVTPTLDNELLVAVMYHTGSDRTLTEEALWNLIYENEGGSADIPISAVYKIQTTATTEDADWTIGTGSVGWAAVIATYKAAATGPTGTESRQAQVSDAASISFTQGLAATESNQAQNSDIAILYSYGNYIVGPLYPGTALLGSVAPSRPWVSPANIYSDNAAYASVTDTSFDAGSLTGILYARAFGFAIPTQAVINGLLLEIEKYCSTGSGRDATVSIMTGTVTFQGNNLAQAATVAWASAAGGTTLYGDSTNTWGLTLTPGSINDVNFGFGMVGRASAANSDIWIDYMRVTAYYYMTDGAFGITAEQDYQAQVSDAAGVTFTTPSTGPVGTEANQLQVSDAAVLGVWTPITPAEGRQAQVSDASILGVTYPIIVAEGAQAQASDAAVIGVYHVIAPAKNFQAQVSDAAVITAISPITPAEAAQAQTSDAAVLGVTYSIATAEGRQAQVSDAASISVITPLAPAEAVQLQVSDAALISAITPLAPTDSNQAQVSDLAVISAAGATNITPAQANQAQVSDAAGISAISPIAPSKAVQVQVSDAAGISFAGIGTTNITPADSNQAQVSDTAVLGVFHVITTTDANQAQVSDSATLTPIYVIAPAQANQAQTSDAAGLSFTAPTFSLTPADANQAQVSDSAIPTAIYVVSTTDAVQSQLSDAALLSVWGIVYHGERQLYELDTRDTSSLDARPEHELDTRSSSVFATRPTHSTGTRVDLEVDDGN